MSLEMRAGVRRFYARFVAGGRRRTFPLKTPVRGIPPPLLSQQGDTAFEESRIRATVEAERVEAEFRAKTTEIRTLERIHELKFGTSVQPVPLAELHTRWQNAHRKRPVSDGHSKTVATYISRFIVFLRREYPGVTEADAITRAQASEFMAELASSGLAPKSWNNALKLVAGVFAVLVRDELIPSNPFEKIPTKDAPFTNRIPFKVDEIKRLLAAVQEDPVLRPIIVTGLSTGLRLADCCLLRWDQVDMQTRFIDIQAVRKTKKPASIPILGLLWSEISAAHQRRDVAGGSPFVFPSLARQYQLYPGKLKHRLDAVLMEIGFKETDIRTANPVGIRRASLRGFHTLKTTFVTLALANGISIELVQRITGNCDAQVVREHYFVPQAETIRAEIATKLPSLLSGTEFRPDPRTDLMATIHAEIAAMTSENWQLKRAKLLEALVAEGIPKQVGGSAA